MTIYECISTATVKHKLGMKKLENSMFIWQQST